MGGVGGCEYEIPSLPFAPLTPLLPLTPSPLAPQVVETLKLNIQYSLPPSLPHPFPPQRWWGPYNLVYNMLRSPSLDFAPFHPLTPCPQFAWSA